MPIRIHNDETFWQTLRQEWETTDVGFIALARKHGISSVTTVKRRQAKEGWSKDQEVIAARRSLANAVLDHVAIEGNADEVARRPRRRPVQPRLPGDRPPDAREPPPAIRGDVSGHDDPPDVSDALALVTRHLTPAEATQNRAQRELALARLVQRASLLVLERIGQVLQRPGPPGGDDDPIGEAVLVANLQRLIRVNPDRETLANLLSTAVKGVESGIAMERRALAPDETGKLAGVPTAGESGGGSRLAREFLRQMDDETMEKMRTWALEVQRQQRQADTGGSPPDPREPPPIRGDVSGPAR